MLDGHPVFRKPGPGRGTRYLYWHPQRRGHIVCDEDTDPMHFMGKLPAGLEVFPVKSPAAVYYVCLSGMRRI